MRRCSEELYSAVLEHLEGLPEGNGPQQCLSQHPAGQ